MPATQPDLALFRSATLVPAAALCLGLMGWQRNDVARNGVSELRFVHDSRARSATVFVPDGAPPAGGWPLVMVLHGAGGSGAQMLRSNGWETVARREQFVVVAPDGTPKDEGRRARFLGNPRTWNSGAGGGLATTGPSATSKGVNDVDYLLALLDTVARRVRVNAKRVFVAGHSNGAGMAYRVASQYPERFAAVGVQAGHLFADAPRTVSPAVSLLQIIGDSDPLMPLDGGPARNGTVGSTELRPALDAPMRWAAMIGAAGPAAIVRNDSLAVRRWGPTTAGAEVVSMLVKGHGHGWLWPGADRMPERLIGPRRASLNSTETLWSFFRSHRRD
jgi:polyhydroxybutyrate depolymerase